MSNALAALDAAAARTSKKEKDEELSPSALWLALTAIPRPSQKVPLPRNIPGTDEPVGYVLMWPLTQEEQMAANAEADRYTKQLLKDPQRKEEANLGYHHTFTNEVAIQVLFRACRDVDDIKRPAFPSPSRMRERLTTDETGVLFSNYCTVQSELGPIRAHMTKEEADALILRLAAGGSAYPLDSYSLEEQRTLLVSTASRLVNCWTAMCSLGLQPDVSSFAMELLEKQDAAIEAASLSDQELGVDDSIASEDLAPPAESTETPVEQ
jgi:hypothetical protein